MALKTVEARASVGSNPTPSAITYYHPGGLIATARIFSASKPSSECV
jgi:hypothetical protein